MLPQSNTLAYCNTTVSPHWCCGYKSKRTRNFNARLLIVNSVQYFGTYVVIFITKVEGVAAAYIRVC
jgi:hypothetical protein